MVFQAYESSITWLQGFKAEFLPQDIGNKIRFVSQGLKTGVEIQGVVGSVMLTNGATLHIVPKMGLFNFYHMLLVTEGLYDELLIDFDKLVSYSHSDLPSLPAILAKYYLTELTWLRKQSIRFSRVPHHIYSEFAFGSTDIVTSTLNLRMRRPLPLKNRFLRRENNIAENRILAAAANIALPLIKSDHSLSVNIINEAQYWIERFLDITSINRDLVDINRRMVDGKFGGVRGYYNHLIAIAKIILSQSGFSSGDTSEVYGSAILINSATLFEEYIRAILIRTYSKDGYVIRKGGQPPEFLYLDGTYRLSPDYCVMTGNKYMMLGDAKYKQPDAKDHYQLYSYLKAFGVDKGVLISPVYSEIGAFNSPQITKDGQRIYEIQLPLLNLGEAEKLLISSFDKISRVH